MVKFNKGLAMSLVLVVLAFDLQGKTLVLTPAQRAQLKLTSSDDALATVALNENGHIVVTPLTKNPGIITVDAAIDTDADTPEFGVGSFQVEWKAGEARTLAFEEVLPADTPVDNAAA
jgi:hypothetical protein